MIEKSVKKERLRLLKKEKQQVLSKSHKMVQISIQFSLQKNKPLLRVDRIK